MNSKTTGPSVTKAGVKHRRSTPSSRSEAGQAKSSGRNGQAAARTSRSAAARGGAGSSQVGSKSLSKSLVVVESPAKAKTLKKYLGAHYMVKASVGHVKDLPKNKLSVDLEAGFTPQYEIIRGKSKVLKEIKDAARHVDTIYLAPDPDREGEAIAWHIAEELGKRHAAHTYRIAFNEITKRAVLNAIENPKPLDRHKFESQQARRILDRIVGYQISPILWDKVRRGLSAGRVQSVAVRLTVEREREISVFVPQEYWSIACLLEGPMPPSFTAKVIKEGEEKFRPCVQDEAQKAVDILKKASFSVHSVLQKERRRRPWPPLMTSKLQQEAAHRLHFTAKRTMMVAQQLYEGVELGAEGSVGLITYMRTDSTRISQDALTSVRTYIEKVYGAAYLPSQPPVYKSKKNAQDAHEAIRPTSMDYPPERIKAHVTSEQYRLYGLIWRFFVASQMSPAVYDQTTVDILAARYTLRATGSVLKFAGFLAVYQNGQNGQNGQNESEDGSVFQEEKPWGTQQDEEGAVAQGGQLPVLAQGDGLRCHRIHPEQHFTQPPPRFSESSLVKELEDKGMGRPSTYATILSTIVTRGYATKQEGRFHPTELGILITDLLTESFPQVLDVAFTAHMEEQLDEVETGKVDWVQLLSDFYHGGFKSSLERAKDNMRDIKREEILTEHVCTSCGQPMVIKWGRNGSFLACKGFPTCRNTRDYKRHSNGTIEIVPEPTTQETCPICAQAMVVKRGRFGQFLACQAYPECKGTRPLSIGVACPSACGGYIAERRSKRGRMFYGCSNYPGCTFVAWDRPMQGPCPLCGSVYLVRKASKRNGWMITCPIKGCGYQGDPELTDEDAQRVAVQ